MPFLQRIDIQRPLFDQFLDNRFQGPLSYDHRWSICLSDHFYHDDCQRIVAHDPLFAIGSRSKFSDIFVTLDTRSS